jgi:ribosomal protein L12E/L44/L45/RPP1/RPP2
LQAKAAKKKDGAELTRQGSVSMEVEAPAAPAAASASSSSSSSDAMDVEKKEENAEEVCTDRATSL